MRFEETNQHPNMGRGECVERLVTIRGDRGSGPVQRCQRICPAHG